MTDLVSQLLLVGIGVVLFITAFILKNKIVALLDAFIWTILSYSLFNYYYNAGDPDAGATVFGFAALSAACAFVMFTSLFWMKDKKDEVVAPADTREDWEIEDEQRAKRLKRLTRYRPRSRFH